MIRFIDLTGQIYLDEKEVSFAFYDTVRDKFCEFSGTQRWDSIEEFKADFTGDNIDRFLSLISIKTDPVFMWKNVMVSINGEGIGTIPIEYDRD